MHKYILFTLAGWFSAVLGFEVSHAAGNAALIISFALLAIVFHKDAT